MKNLITHLNEHIIFKGNLKRSSYKAIDLGLSVKWCDCNVGSKTPEEPGLLFQWGRTDGYEYGSELGTTFELNDGLVKMSANDYINNYNQYVKMQTLDLKDDAAHVNMKDDWRMPTKNEIIELTKLKHKYTLLNGVNGIEFIGKNDNKLFIPACGKFLGYYGRFDDNDNYTNGIISCATSMDNMCAWGLSFSEEYFDVFGHSKINGYPVRGVCK